MDDVDSGDVLYLVVDACILQAAGKESAKDPGAQRARRILEDILNICHHVVLSKEARKEWLEHASPYGIEWENAMQNHRKIKRVELEMQDYMDCLDRLILDDGQYAARVKDLHLVVAALEHGDNIIVSNDQRAANGFKDLGRLIPVFLSLHWWNAGCSIPVRSI